MLYTQIHTGLSLIALVAGVPVVAGLLAGRMPAFWTNLFLATAVLTSVTGFGFPFSGVLPSHVVGVVALLVLALVLVARYGNGLVGGWRAAYAGGMVASLYLLAFVAIVQAFAKIGALHALAPTGSEPPFAVAQGVALLVFLWAGVLGARRFRAVG